MKRKVLVVCHSNRSLGALEVIKCLAQEAIQSTTNVYHFGVFKGIELTNEVPFAYEVNHRSFFQRVMFERFELPRVIRQGEYDYVLSLQNFVLGNYRVPTGLLVHQGLIMLDYDYPIFEGKLKLKVFLQKLLFRLFQRHVKNFYVQLPWMKEKLIEKYRIQPEAISIVRTHEIQTGFQGMIQNHSSFQFIYPASAYDYKNHAVIVEALQRLKTEDLRKMKIQFTLNEGENRYATSLSNKVKQSQLPIEFIGTIKHSELVHRYESHSLLFSSLVESQGFPLIEAMKAGSLIVAINLPYAKQTLLDYPNAMYFDSAESLANIFKSILNDQYPMVPNIYSKRFEHPSLVMHLEEAQL
jgi:glycosyltransferase involved in cell wall biosynthesis